jgi:hypothetical protein
MLHPIANISHQAHVSYDLGVIINTPTVPEPNVGQSATMTPSNNLTSVIIAYRSIFDDTGTNNSHDFRI